MADRITVDYDLRLRTGGHVKLGVDASLNCSAADKAFILSVLGSVAGFARLTSPEAPVPESKPAAEVIGRFGPQPRAV